MASPSTARCPHCGRPDAPVEDGFIDRHRRADWVVDVSLSNELCFVTGRLGLRPGDRCRHFVPNVHCCDAELSNR